VLGKPLRDVGLRRGDPQHRRRDLLPDRVDLLHSVHRRERQLVPRIGHQHRAAVGLRLRPVAREEQRALAGQARVVFLQAVGDRLEIRVRRELRRTGERVEPARELARRLLRRFGGNAEAFERDHARDALRPDAGVLHDDVAAEAVPDEVDGLRGREVVEQRLQVGDVVGEPVALRLPLGAPEAAQVRRDRVPVARERVDEELERRADVHPAVHEEELRRRGIAPGQHLVVEPAQRDAVRARRLHRAAGGASEGNGVSGKAESRAKFA
jgi:hypothetical protein